jgi:hypothetical protein
MMRTMKATMCLACRTTTHSCSERECTCS